MIEKKFLTFSLQSEITESIALIQTRIEHALGCKFEDGTFHGQYALVCNVFGIQIALYSFCRTDGKKVFQLDGFPRTEDTFKVIWEEIRIDLAISNALKHGGAGNWLEPMHNQ